MDKINLNLKNKRVHSVGISQSMNVKKLVDEYIEENKLSNVAKMYIGSDKVYAETIEFNHYFYDYFKGELITPIDIQYKLIKELPDCDVLIVLVDSAIDNSIPDMLLHNVSLKTHIVYIFDNLICDYSDGEFMKRFLNPDCIVNTYNRRPDIKPSLNILLNKIKKNNISYLTDPELIIDSENIITFERMKDDELLDYDKIIILNDDDVSEFNIRIRNLLSRGFLPEARDKMVNYTPMEVSIVNTEGEYEKLYIPIYSELKVVDKIQDPEGFTPPIYRFAYTDYNDTEYEFEIPINTSFIDNMNNNSVSHDGIPLSFSGYKLYFAYALPLFAVSKRYDKIALIVSDFVLSKSVLYSGIRYAKDSFKLCYSTNCLIS